MNHKIAQLYSSYPPTNKATHTTIGTNPRNLVATLLILTATIIAPPMDNTKVKKFSTAQLDKWSCHGAY